jgi:hypothetical protein
VNPVLFIALIASLMVIVCWAGAQVMRRSMERTRRREAERRGGLIDVDFTRRRL